MVETVSTVRFNVPSAEQDLTTAKQRAETMKAMLQTIFLDVDHVGHRVTQNCRLNTASITLH